MVYGSQQGTCSGGGIWEASRADRLGGTGSACPLCPWPCSAAFDGGVATGDGVHAMKRWQRVLG